LESQTNSNQRIFPIDANLLKCTPFSLFFIIYSFIFLKKIVPSDFSKESEAKGNNSNPNKSKANLFLFLFYFVLFCFVL
jgi:cell division protein FtsI/penicillin-binding protein 2